MRTRIIRRRRPLVTAAAIFGAGFLVASFYNGAPSASAATNLRAGRFPGPTRSSPIAVSPDDRFVWVANPENNSVSVINVEYDANRKVAEIGVGAEPTHVAISPDGKWVFVANTVSGTVSVIDAGSEQPSLYTNIPVGVEPYGMALTPNGKYLYVANARSNDVYVIDAESFRVDCIIDDVGLEPRGIAITNDGDDDDTDEKVYVTQFMGVDRPTVIIGADDYKEGRVTVISTDAHRVVNEVVLNPIRNTGFASNGSALNRVAAVDPLAFTFTTGAFPNQLNSIAIYGSRAYVPNTGASPDGPVRFNVNVQSLLGVIDTTQDVEGAAGEDVQTINMNRGINFEPAGANKIFPSSPWAITFKRSAPEGYVVSAASNMIVKVSLDDNGTPTINAPRAAGEAGNVVRIFVGQNPRGIALNSRDDRAYVMDEVSRNVSIIDLGTNTVMATVQSADLPYPGTPEAQVLLGKALFNSSTGVNMPDMGSAWVVQNRMSSEGWSSCFACHPFGLTDGVVWIFAAGPRRTVPMNTTFAPKDPNDQKILNHSAIFDEVQDFELNIRGVSGGLGLITQADGTTPEPTVAAFTPPNTGRSVHWDAINQYVALGIRTPISPLAKVNPRSTTGQAIAHGRTLFDRVNCVSCHGGRGWSSSRRNFTPPPAAADISNGQIVRLLRKVGTFDSTARNEVRATGAPPLGADGYTPPSLLGAFALGPYLHNGSALTLDNVLENATHRAAGTNGVDQLADARDRAALVLFLKSIDASTESFQIR
jgi:YVTN family beta-propeller protein